MEAVENNTQLQKRLEKAFEASFEKVSSQNYSHNELIVELAMTIALWELDREFFLKIADDKSEVKFLDGTVKPLLETAKMLMSVIGHQNKRIETLAQKPKLIATKGGKAKASKYKILEAETLRLYKLGNWSSVPQAALHITPVIVEMSKHGNGDLLPTTTKPLEWIRAYKKRQISDPC